MKRDVELGLLERALERVKDRTRSHADAERRVSVERYHSPDWYRREQDLIFSKVPSMLVHGSELAGPGSFLTMTHFGRPLLVNRNDAGEARAFLNVCRHRGTQLMRVESGTAKRFSCGYHAWTYDTNGVLRSVPSAACFPSVKIGERNLVSLPVVEAYGFIWLMPGPGQSREHLDAFLGPVGEDLAALQLDAHEIYGLEHQTWDINWKLFVEGTLEGYHFPILHAKSANVLFEDNCLFFDNFWPHLRSVIPKRSLNLISKRPRESWVLTEVANVIYTVFPNETILRQSDHLLWMTAHPLSPERTLVKLRLIIPRGSAAGERAADWEANKAFTYQVQREDLEIYRAIQLGVHSGANAEHCFGSQESALAQFNANVERFPERSG